MNVSFKNGGHAVILRFVLSDYAGLSKIDGDQGTAASPDLGLKPIDYEK